MEDKKENVDLLDDNRELTDALDELLNLTNLEAFLTNAEMFDCGSLKGYIGANVALASQDKDMLDYINQVLINK